MMVAAIVLIFTVPFGFWLARRGWHGTRFGGYALFVGGYAIIMIGIVASILLSQNSVH